MLISEAKEAVVTVIDGLIEANTEVVEIQESWKDKPNSAAKAEALCQALPMSYKTTLLFLAGRLVDIAQNMENV